MRSSHAVSMMLKSVQCKHENIFGRHKRLTSIVLVNLQRKSTPYIYQYEAVRCGRAALGVA